MSTNEDRPIVNEKYITFKRDEWDAIADDKGSATKNQFLRIEVEDAVVVRLQDPLAGPALHVYSAMAAAMADILNDHGEDATALRLRKIANYFAQMESFSAEFSPKRLPD